MPILTAVSAAAPDPEPSCALTARAAAEAIAATMRVPPGIPLVDFVTTAVTWSTDTVFAAFPCVPSGLSDETALLFARRHLVDEALRRDLTLVGPISMLWRPTADAQGPEYPWEPTRPTGSLPADLRISCPVRPLLIEE